MLLWEALPCRAVSSIPPLGGAAEPPRPAARGAAGPRAGPGRPRRPGGASPCRASASVIVLWMAGGVTHLDWFRPQAAARPSRWRVAGLHPDDAAGRALGEVMPFLARQAGGCAMMQLPPATNDHFLAQAYAFPAGTRGPAHHGGPERRAPGVASSGPRAGLPGYVAVPGTRGLGRRRPTCSSAVGWAPLRYTDRPASRRSASAW